MLRILLLSTVALIGCTKQNPDFCPAHMDDPRCGGMGSNDGGMDGRRVDGPPDSLACFGGGAFEVCPMGATTGMKTLNGPIDTTLNAAGSQCDSSQYWAQANAATCFIVADQITVMNVRVTGGRPLALVANTIDVVGHLDASSKIADMTVGPGSLSPGTCGTFGNVNGTSAAGGGAGASFANAGTGGNSGGDGESGTHAGGTAYAPFLAVPPGTLRAGCTGQVGGQGQAGGGIGGWGGGSVYLVAATSISMGASGIVNASGAGGGAASKTGGGGGGGSGGMIILLAPTFSITNGAIVVANGGSGSTGGSSNGNGAGVRGNDPDPTHPMTPAPGPMLTAGTTAMGGAGYAIGSPSTGGQNGASGEGGGGGGGGGGYIQSSADLAPAKVSPAANVVL